MKIKVTVNKTQWIKRYITIWAAALKLAPREVVLLCKIIEHYMDIRDKVGEDKQLMDELFMSIKAKKAIREALGFSDQHFANYRDKLVTKKALIYSNGSYSVSPHLIPQTTLTFEFTVTN